VELHLNDELETLWGQIDTGIVLGEEAEVYGVIGVHLGTVHLGARCLPFKGFARIDGEIVFKKL
jgi:hypothetical protein